MAAAAAAIMQSGIARAERLHPGRRKIKSKTCADAIQPKGHRAINQTAARGLKVKTNVKAGGLQIQHNQSMARGLKARSNVKAGCLQLQHNQTVTKGLKVKSGVKAGSVNYTKIKF